MPSHTIALYKPYDVLCQFSDAGARRTLKELVPIKGIYPAGRLDRDSEGLLLLTDDGQLAHRLTDPRFDHPKTYLVQVERVPDPEALERLRRGVVLNDGPTRPALIDLLAEAPALPDRSVPIRFRKNVPTAWLRLTIREGRNRQVRRMTATVGHPTLRLVRVAIGPVSLGDLAPGQWRELNAEELAALEKIGDERHAASIARSRRSASKIVRPVQLRARADDSSHGRAVNWSTLEDVDRTCSRAFTSSFLKRSSTMASPARVDKMITLEEPGESTR